MLNLGSNQIYRSGCKIGVSSTDEGVPRCAQ
ncbi:unnamed protein product [Fusarium venenatum]|uniref:Uncharacterized protein n=1 Tax=Fusarium venenatum TaxID=56646 RepID=A0A2L2TJJ5_9HYPO|nr:uncharacterized protein FVRRES_04866 [Fusarium venenatum]CEI60430.1 unnamed protein product [Fusarium venenatum]